ncbi:MAG: hypothetical protein Q8K79_09520 [Solirubrobacteraceae bacterium]|nr:hypothetical protein [Solirubrobacteraceae bacterium]
MIESIIVTVAGEAEPVAEQLRAAGMTVDRVLGAVGIVTGSVDSERRASLAAVPGVVAVELDRPVGLAPPDAEIQSLDDSARLPAEPRTERSGASRFDGPRSR